MGTVDAIDAGMRRRLFVLSNLAIFMIGLGFAVRANIAADLQRDLFDACENNGTRVCGKCLWDHDWPGAGRTANASTRNPTDIDPRVRRPAGSAWGSGNAAVTLEIHAGMSDVEC